MHDRIKTAGGVIGGGILLGIILINVFGGIVSGLWLLLIGLWPLVVLGFISSLIMPWGFTIASLPSMFIFAPLITKAVEKQKRGVFLTLGFINGVYTNFLILLWVFLVFNAIVIQMLEQGVGHPFLLTIFAYSIAIGPLTYMAKGEDNNAVGTNLGLLMALIGFVALTVIWFAGWFGSPAMSLIFWLLILGTSWLIMKVASGSFDSSHENRGA